jgi:hypothetical protein
MANQAAQKFHRSIFGKYFLYYEFQNRLEYAKL